MRDIETNSLGPRFTVFAFPLYKDDLSVSIDSLSLELESFGMSCGLVTQEDARDGLREGSVVLWESNRGYSIEEMLNEIDENERICNSEGYRISYDNGNVDWDTDTSGDTGLRLDDFEELLAPDALEGAESRILFLGVPTAQCVNANEFIRLSRSFLISEQDARCLGLSFNDSVYGPIREFETMVLLNVESLDEFLKDSKVFCRNTRTDCLEKRNSKDTSITDLRKTSSSFALCGSKDCIVIDSEFCDMVLYVKGVEVPRKSGEPDLIDLACTTFKW